MSNKKIKIIHWDDDSVMKSFITGMIPNILGEFDCQVEQGDFTSSRSEFSEKIKLLKYDLIILDIEDETDKMSKSDVGFELLNEVLATYKNIIPLLIFSRHPRVLEKIDDFKKEHKLNIEFLNKSQRGEPTYQQKVKEKLRSLLNLGLQDIELSLSNDFKTKAAAKSIGVHNLKVIISLYLNSKAILGKEKINVRAIAPGYSGAYVLEVTFDTTSRLIKISHDKATVLREYENLNSYSTFLPSTIKIDHEKIDPTHLSSEGWYAIVYEFVSYSNTLFGFMAQNKDARSEIEKLLATIFSDERILKLYLNTQEIQISLNEIILEDIDSVRASFVENAIKNLEPILKTYVTEFDQNLIDSILEHHSYCNISAVKIRDPMSKKILSHGDLHSDNILVDSLHSPIIIDPGNINYKYWAYDINRLLVDFFIRGMDYETQDYFDVNSIKTNYTIFQSILARKPISNSDSRTDSGFIWGINWITQNISIIHKDNFVEWQYQLGLALELLKASYKSISLPANKRALALLCVCEAIRKANVTIDSGVS